MSDYDADALDRADQDRMDEALHRSYGPSDSNTVYLVTTGSSDGDSETQRALGPAPDGVHPLPAGRYTMLHRDGTRGQSLILNHGVTGIEMRLADGETSECREDWAL